MWSPCLKGSEKEFLIQEKQLLASCLRNYISTLLWSHIYTSLYLSQELLDLIVCFNRIRWGQGTDSRDKLRLSFEDRGLQRRDLIMSSMRNGSSESPLLIEQWRIDIVEELKKKPPPLRRKMEIYLPRQTSFIC